VNRWRDEPPAEAEPLKNVKPNTGIRSSWRCIAQWLTIFEAEGKQLFDCVNPGKLGVDIDFKERSSPHISGGFCKRSSQFEEELRNL
jgi:hypothetical protein